MSAPRVVFIGDSCVGKTSILACLIGASFTDSQTSTVGATHQKIVREVRGDPVELQIWDTAGQEKYKSLGSFYYKGAMAALAVYDITSSRTFDHINDWISSFLAEVGTEGIVYVVGNKADLATSREVSLDEASDWAVGRGYSHFEVSAKTGENINPMIDNLASVVQESFAERNRIVTIPVEATGQTSCC
jgi:small GTP-binding protein